MINCTQLYTLPLINTMPPLSTNGTEDGDTFFTIFKLDSDRFTHFSGNNNALSDSTPVGPDCTYLLSTTYDLLSYFLVLYCLPPVSVACTYLIYIELLKLVLIDKVLILNYLV